MQYTWEAKDIRPGRRAAFEPDQPARLMVIQHQVDRSTFGIVNLETGLILYDGLTAQGASDKLNNNSCVPDTIS